MTSNSLTAIHVMKLLTGMTRRSLLGFRRNDQTCHQKWENCL